MIRKFSLDRRLSLCEHRTVSKAGRIICAKIAEGDNVVSPDICRTCPVKAVNCTQLRFTLCQTTPSALVVRFNGRTEVWDDDPPEVRFEQAACAARVMPVEHPRVCAGCTLRQPADAPAQQPLRRRRRVVGQGKVVAFPGGSAVASRG